MKICFLDIDGVLNSQLYYMSEEFQKTKGNNDSELEYDINQIDPIAIGFLNDFVEETNCKIVLSSSWRHTAFDERILYHRGFKGDVIDVTPTLIGAGLVRGNAIYRWIIQNTDLLESKSYEYNNYVIFDDDSDMLLWQKDNFFQTDTYCGLTPNITYRAKNFLNRISNG